MSKCTNPKVHIQWSQISLVFVAVILLSHSPSPKVKTDVQHIPTQLESPLTHCFVRAKHVLKYQLDVDPVILLNGFICEKVNKEGLKTLHKEAVYHDYLSHDI